MTAIRLLLFSSLFLAGCANEGAVYARKHPELSAEQRQILATGKIATGTAVAGLTHEQVKLAMHGFPTTFDRINGEEAWVYTRKAASTLSAMDQQTSSSSSFGKPEAFSASDNPPVEAEATISTTVFFQGDRATHAQTEEKR